MQRLSILVLLAMLAGCQRDAAPAREAGVADAAPTVVSRVAPASPGMDELLDYLRREFGEAPDDPKALQAGDLTFVATLKFANRVEHVWRFPCAARTGCWLRVTQEPTQQWTGWSTDPPTVL